MGRKKAWGVAFFAIAVALSAVIGIFYVQTGGSGLSRVIWYYFLRDIPDKKYSWQDFTDRGARAGISGFYAYGDDDSFSMWTLSGLKTFTHIPEISVYQHEDVCFALKQLQVDPQGLTKSAKADSTITGDFALWRSWIKQEYLVTVIRLEGGEYRNGIDKIWSYSGRYKKLNVLEQDTCE